MIKLSKRLQNVASFVRNDAKVADVGCDHALLDIYLVELFPSIRVTAVDMRKGALNQAHQNIDKYNMNNKIKLCLSDGLDGVESDEMDTIVISGMGCSSIINILIKDQNKLHNIDDLIVQSNNDYYTVRQSICQLGYYIKHERLVKDRGIIYVIIHFAKGYQEYSDDDYLFGPLLRLERDKLYKEWLSEDLKKKEILYSLIPQKYCSQKEQVGKDILKLKSEIK